MKTASESLQDMKRTFLNRQNVLIDVTEGTVIHGVLGTVANEVENLYDEMNRFYSDMYIDRASGAELDKLIQGNFRLRRSPGTHAHGYVIFQASAPLTPDDISGLFGTIPLALYDSASSTPYLSDEAMSIDVTDPRTGDLRTYQVVLPNSLNLSGTAISAATPYDLGNLLLADLLTFLGQAKAPVSHLVLPVVAAQPGVSGNLRGGEIRSMGGQLPRFLVGATNFPTLYLVNSTGTAHQVYDPDGVAYVSDHVELRLSTRGNLSGGSDQESDSNYRARFHAWLNTRPTGTVEALIDEARNTPGVSDVRVREAADLLEMRVVPTPEASGDAASLALRVRRNLEQVRAAGTRLFVAYAEPTRYHCVVHVRPASLRSQDLAETVKTVKSGVTASFNTLDFDASLTSYQVGRQALSGLLNAHNVERIDLYYALDDVLFRSLSDFYLTWGSSESMNWRVLNSDYLAQYGRPWMDFTVWRYLVTLGRTGITPKNLQLLAQQLGRPLDDLDLTQYFGNEALLYLEPFTGVMDHPALRCAENENVRRIKEEALKVTLLSVPPVMYKQVAGLSIDQRRTQSIKPDLNVVDVVCMRPDIHPGARDPYPERMSAQLLVNNYEEPLSPGPLSHLALGENPLVSTLVVGMSSMVGVNILEGQ